MHQYAILSSREEVEKFLVPVLKRIGAEIPPSGQYIAAVEFDERGEVVAYQMAQNAIFLEGMYAKDGSAHLLRLHNMVIKHLEKEFGAKRVMTMARQDETGERIGKLAQALGYVQMKWNVFRREL